MCRAMWERMGDGYDGCGWLHHQADQQFGRNAYQWEDLGLSDLTQVFGSPRL